MPLELGGGASPARCWRRLGAAMETVEKEERENEKNGKKKKKRDGQLYTYDKPKYKRVDFRGVF